MERVAFTVGNEGREVFWNAEHFEAFLLYCGGAGCLCIYRRWQIWKGHRQTGAKVGQYPGAPQVLLMTVYSGQTWGIPASCTA